MKMPRFPLHRHRPMISTRFKSANYLYARSVIGADLGVCKSYPPIRPFSKRSGNGNESPKIPIKTKPTALQLFKTFPAGVGRIVDGIYGYWNINEAALTKKNKWSQLGGVGYIPRRQCEQKRKLRRDLEKVALPVAFGLLPVIGNSIFILLAWRPNFFLSSHFLEGHQRSIAHDEYRERLGAFEACADNFWITVMKGSSQHDTNLEVSGSDEAGAIVNALTLYELCDNVPAKSIPRHQLLQIAKAAGMAPGIVWALPSIWIRFCLRRIVRDIVLDDADLLRDKIHKDGCSSLTDDEVLNACLLRGLPCSLYASFDNMRKCLTNHLMMVEPLFKNVGKASLMDSSKGTMFFLHLSAIRYKLKRSPSLNGSPSHPDTVGE